MARHSFLVVMASCLARLSLSAAATAGECQEDSIQLQVHDFDAARLAAAECALPTGAVWAEVTAGTAPFQMAVYSNNDIVSGSLLTTHNWEDVNASLYGPPGHAYDIGGNLGFYTFLLAKAGWNVTTFEPMQSNLAMMNATLCANPDIKNQIDVQAFGLGNATTHCQLVSSNANVGDGTVHCNGKYLLGSYKHHSNHLPPGFAVRAEFDVKRLDDVMQSTKFAQQHVDFVKIDVEGYECLVFEGASQLLAQRPRLIQSEVWQTMQGCTPKHYLDIFSTHKYQIKADVTCQKDGPTEGPPEIDGPSGSYLNYWFCDPQPSRA